MKALAPNTNVNANENRPKDYSNWSSSTNTHTHSREFQTVWVIKNSNFMNSQHCNFDWKYFKLSKVCQIFLLAYFYINRDTA